MERWEATLGPPGDASEEALWWCVQGNRVLVSESGALPGTAPADGADALFLGVLGGRPCWAVEIEATATAPDGYAFTDLFSLHPLVGEQRWAIAGRAVQLVDWARCHRYCGRCGAATVPSPGERARKCPECGLLAFPRLAPAVITLVSRGPEALLARNVNFGVAMYSCIAGFVEPGETLEEAVAREVREEVGVEVRDVRYQSSQPWPFPHSLMLGFRAEWASGDIEIEPAEIADAQWFRFDQLPQVPPGISIARRLIDGWVAEARAGA
ncbi:MAG TPA: NAD(+) diphosphatase [Acidimicrobiales bacterium]|nr:NAD(+) diphosphatase [Acidimicrobiales bacterium]